MPDYQLFHGDCLEVLPTMAAGSVDAVITDPPYPGLKGGTVHLKGGVAKTISVNATIGEEWNLPFEAWLPDAWRIARYGVMIFCSHHSIDELPKYCDGAIRTGVVCWYKRNSPNPVNNVPKFNVEYVWLLKKASSLIWRELSLHYDIPMPNAGCMKTERILRKDSKKAEHPTQKPLRLMSELLKAIKPGMTIVDPFMGTGTTIIAAIQRGVHALGIEKDLNYYQIASRRIEAAAQQPPLFTEAAAPLQVTQYEMFLHSRRK